MLNRKLKDEEIEVLVGLVRESGARSYLEIGSEFGDSLQRIASAMPKGAKIVSVDLNGGDRLVRCITDLKQRGYDAQLIVGNSMDSAIIDKARSLGPYDVLFIDGNHKAMYVKSDWENYGPLAKMVAFHDIAWCRASGGIPNRIMVPALWTSIKDQYKHQEIVLDPEQNTYGVGVLWR